MKTFFKIFALILLAQLIGHFSLAACSCGGFPPTDPKMLAGCTDCVNGGPACKWEGSRTCSDNNLSSGAAVKLNNPLGDTTTVPILIGNIINAALGIVGSLALIMFIYGGFTWMLAAGNESAVEKGKNIITWAAIGLVVIFASYSLVRAVIAAITKGATQ
jgi:hypothetical protein